MPFPGTAAEKNDLLGAIERSTPACVCPSGWPSTCDSCIERAGLWCTLAVSEITEPLLTMRRNVQVWVDAERREDVG